MSGTEGGIISSTDLTSFDSNVLLESTKHGHHITALIGIPMGTVTSESESESESGSDDSYVGGYVSGCKDATIRLFDGNHKLVRTLTGHEKAVTSLSWLNVSKHNHILISGSWDGTAKLWDIYNGQCLATMDGHENTVSVQGLPPTTDNNGNIHAMGRFVTGSAGIATGNVITDHKIRLYQVTLPNTDHIHTLSVTLTKTIPNDHDGPIRGLAFDAITAMILSSSNDGTVHVRDSYSGQSVLTLRTAPLQSNQQQQQQQPPMLLDVTSLPAGAGKIAACSEDGNVFLWDTSNTNKNNHQQTHTPQIIPHPNCVWKIEALPNGDLVTACHDGIIRIFTLDEHRVASPQDIAIFHDAVIDARSKTSSGPTQEEIANLPRWEDQTNHSGKSEGQVQVFSKGNKAIAAQWSATSQTWIEVGEVTGSNDSTGTINGVQFDHVFPIEIDVAGGGVQNLQIGYNNGENPFTTAQTFIDQHMLDQNYLSQIADYIRQRTGESSIPTLGGATHPAGAANNASAARGGVSPMDVDISPPSYQELPMVGYKSFESGADTKTLKKIMDKIRQFNADILNDNDNNILSSDETDMLDNLCMTLGATSRYHASSISTAELKVIHNMVTGWSSAHAFPALDLARLAVLHPDATKSSRSAFWAGIIKATLDKCEVVNEEGVTNPSVAIPMLSFRLFANCFRGGSGSLNAVGSQLSHVLKCAETFSLATNKNIRLAVSTVLLNATSYLKHVPGTCADLHVDSVLSPAGKILGSGLYETEATVRVLVALGTVLLANDKFLKRAKELNMASMFQNDSSQHGAKASAVAKEILMILE